MVFSGDSLAVDVLNALARVHAGGVQDRVKRLHRGWQVRLTALRFSYLTGRQPPRRSLQRLESTATGVLGLVCKPSEVTRAIRRRATERARILCLCLGAAAAAAVVWGGLLALFIHSGIRPVPACTPS